MSFKFICMLRQSSNYFCQYTAFFNVDSCTWLETANKAILTLPGRVSEIIKTAQTSLSGLESLWSHEN